MHAPHHEGRARPSLFVLIYILSRWRPSIPFFRKPIYESHHAWRRARCDGSASGTRNSYTTRLRLIGRLHWYGPRQRPTLCTGSGSRTATSIEYIRIEGARNDMAPCLAACTSPRAIGVSGCLIRWHRCVLAAVPLYTAHPRTHATSRVHDPLACVHACAATPHPQRFETDAGALIAAGAARPSPAAGGTAAWREAPFG